jgi:hypothetical protein
MLHPGEGAAIQQEIPQGPAAEGTHESDREDPDYIHPLANGLDQARDGKGTDGGNFDDSQHDFNLILLVN